MTTQEIFEARGYIVISSDRLDDQVGDVWGERQNMTYQSGEISEGPVRVVAETDVADWLEQAVLAKLTPKQKLLGSSFPYYYRVVAE